MAYFPNLRSIHLLWPPCPSTRSVQLRNWRRGCKVRTKPTRWEVQIPAPEQLACVTTREGYGTLRCPARCKEGLVCSDGVHLRPRQKPRGDRERRCGDEGIWRVKQANSSVQDSVGYFLFSPINSRNDVARAIGVKPATVSR